MTFEVGSVIAQRYRITVGMGEVYAAHDATLDTELAFKTILQPSTMALER